MKRTYRHFLSLAALLVYLGTSGLGCGPAIPWLLDIAISAGTTFCATKGGELLDKAFDALVDIFMDKIGKPTHDKATASKADDQHPTLLIDPHNPKLATAMGFTEIRFGGKHGAETCSARLLNAHFVKQSDGTWILSPDEKKAALTALMGSIK